MIEKDLLIRNKHGLHARPAALLVRITAKFKSDIFITKDDIEVNGKSILGVMTLAAEPGSTINVKVEGEDEKEAFEAIENLILNGFNDD